MNTKIAITGCATLSALGNNPEEIWNRYLQAAHGFIQQDVQGKKEWIAPLPDAVKAALQELRTSDIKYKPLDATVIMAVAVSRKAVEMAGWQSDDAVGINFGSSRGATTLFENDHLEFIQTGKVSTLTSPTTTLGNISSWVSHDLQTQGPVISHSITCSTGLHAVLNAVAWLRSGMSEKFLAGASEAPLTPFTIAQMKALKIYSAEESDYPCKALDLDKKKNTMVLGEASGVLALEINPKTKPLAYIIGLGYATEKLKHNISISEDAECFQKSMKMALDEAGLDRVDAVVMHAPGTIKGDATEFEAIKIIFKNQLPMLTTNKWLLGHTFATSGILSIEMALIMLQHQQFIESPFYQNLNSKETFKTVMINAVGFGGNAVSVIVSI